MRISIATTYRPILRKNSYLHNQAVTEVVMYLLILMMFDKCFVFSFYLLNYTSILSDFEQQP